MPQKDQHDDLAEQLVKQDLISQEDLDKAREREAQSGTPWYRQLLQMKKMDFGPFESILRYEFHPKAVRQQQKSLGEALVELKAISEEQLRIALEEQEKTGRLIGNILLDKGFVTRQTISMALSKQYGMDYADLKHTPSERAALEAVPEGMAKRNQMVPIKLEGDKLTVLIASPQVHGVLRDVGVLLGKRIHAVLTTTNDINSEIVARYRGLHVVQEPVEIPVKDVEKELPTKKKTAKKKAASKAKKNKTKQAAVVEQDQEPEEDTDVSREVDETIERDASRFEEIARQAEGLPVIKLVNTIIEGAVNSGATDVHLDPQEPEMRVRYRIDGVLHDIMSIPYDIEPAVVSRLKIMADIDITETRHPQDGHMSLEIGDMEYDVRVATLPTFLGERVVLRLLDQSSILAGIKDLGLDSADEKKLGELIQQPYGMILVTGPTGSGKTTTLYACLNQKNVMTDSIVTLEDPVEYQLSGINQVQIDPDINRTFAATLRAALRQDIDVLLVGEVRDAETARIAIRAAMTGHLVFSTLHTNDAPEAISTLRNMDVPSYLIASALTAVVGQRLIRRICPNCKTSYAPTKALLRTLGLPESTRKLYKGKGCDTCYHTGYRGRTGVFEVLEITTEIRKLIAADEPVEKIMKTAKLKTMAQRCREKVKEGETTAEEYLRTIRS